MTYDVTIIGSGPGGYVAAIRCAQLGFKTAIVERYPTLGGTCLNVGCIPSKALLDSSEHYHDAVHRFAEHGIQVDNVAVDMPQMMTRKAGVVEQMTKGVDFLMKKNKVDVHQGHGSFKDAHTITVTKDDGSAEELTTERVIIATGSKPIAPAAFNYDKDRVITSTEALKLEAVPKSMVVIGGGVIGLELGSVYARLGTQVDVIEFGDRIIAGMDGDCSKELTRSLKKIGVKFHLKHAVKEVQPSGKTDGGKTTGVTVSYAKRGQEDEVLTIDADYCLVAIGRGPYTAKLGLENVPGVELDEKGRVVVDDHLRTGVSHIYAIGDVIKGAMLAHKAEEEGVFVAEHMAGQRPHVNYNLIPGVVYTWPEVAGVGQTEEQLKEAGAKYKSGKFPYRALGRAHASMDVEGMVKILADAETDEVLGVHMVGARVADLIAEAVAVMEYRGSAEDIARMSHAHPTYGEAMKEAALAATADRALHV